MLGVLVRYVHTGYSEPAGFFHVSATLETNKELSALYQRLARLLWLDGEADRVLELRHIPVAVRGTSPGSALMLLISEKEARFFADTPAGMAEAQQCLFAEVDACLRADLCVQRVCEGQKWAGLPLDEDSAGYPFRVVFQPDVD